MNLNLFRVLTPEEQAAVQEYTDIAIWSAACQALGATPQQIAAYENDAQAFARTTIYPNSAIMAAARRAAKEALLRGQPMPTDVEAAVQRLFAQQLADLLGLCQHPRRAREGGSRGEAPIGRDGHG